MGKSWRNESFSLDIGMEKVGKQKKKIKKRQTYIRYMMKGYRRGRGDYVCMYFNKVNLIDRYRYVKVSLK